SGHDRIRPATIWNRFTCRKGRGLRFLSDFVRYRQHVGIGLPFFRFSRDIREDRRVVEARRLIALCLSGLWSLDSVVLSENQAGAQCLLWPHSRIFRQVDATAWNADRDAKNER